jgi:hypothetical protein
MAAERVTGGYVVTSGTFTKDAKDFAAERNIELIDGKGLEALLRDGRSVAPALIRPIDLSLGRFQRFSPNRNEYEIIELRSRGVRAIIIARSTSRRTVRARMTGSDAPGITRILFSPNERDLPCRIAVYEW